MHYGTVPIEAIVRELHVSRHTVRKVLRSGATAFAYEREVQPLPKLGRWQDELDRLLVANDLRPALCAQLAPRARIFGGASFRAAELRAERGLPVRLELRGCADHAVGCGDPAAPHAA
jgi:hypothetical protein